MKTLRLMPLVVGFGLCLVAAVGAATSRNISTRSIAVSPGTGAASRQLAVTPPEVKQRLQAQDLSTGDLTTGLTALDVVNMLVGASTITIANVHYNGAPVALGTFTGGRGIIGFDSGIVLSTGGVSSVIGPNTVPGISTRNDYAGDGALEALIPGLQTNDAAVLEFDFTCADIRRIAFEYVFASEEYNEFVDSSYNDVFGFFVNGTNIALLPDKVTPVAINTVNGGNPFGTHATNPAYYRNNDCEDTACPVNTEMDGLTVVLVASASIRPGTNHIKLAIADATDDIYDSDVFIRARSLICGEIANTPPVCTLDPVGPFAVNAGHPLTFTVRGTDADTGNTITLSVLGSLPAGAAMTPSLPLSGTYTGVSSSFTWTPPQEGRAVVRFLVADNRGAADTATAEIRIREGVPPGIRSADPADGAIDVAWDRPILITFSESVVPALVDSNVRVVSQRYGPLPVTISLLANAPTLRITAYWPRDDEITVRVLATLTDLAGNGLDGNGNGVAEGSPTDDYVYTMTTMPGVRPGDANNDGMVDERDILPLGRFWLRSGPRRTSSGILWSIEPASAWHPRDATYADCNGDGVIDSLDICPIADFFDRTAEGKVAVGDLFSREWCALSEDVIQSLSRALLNCPGVSEERRLQLQQWLTSRSTSPSTVPRGFQLDQNYPNPFNAGTVIHYRLDVDADILLDIVDILGRPVRTLVDRPQAGGVYYVAWDGRDKRGSALASGVYFYRLHAGGLTLSKRMVMLR